MEKKTGQRKKSIDQPSKTDYIFRLFVAGASPNSVKAINNLKQICDTYLVGRYMLEIIDVYQQPAIAKEEQIIALPLLVKKGPLPQRKLIGDLSDTNKVLRVLALIA